MGILPGIQSREERKMEAYIRAFEKLEKKEKRKEFLQQQSLGKNLSSSTANNADTSTQFTTQSTSLPVSTNKEEVPYFIAMYIMCSTNLWRLVFLEGNRDFKLREMTPNRETICVTTANFIF